jgi:hypothetical protein
VAAAVVWCWGRSGPLQDVGASWHQHLQAFSLPLLLLLLLLREEAVQRHHQQQLWMS